jgi:hypothetical protein
MGEFRAPYSYLFPGLMLSLRKRPPHQWSVAIGIVVGLALLILFAVATYFAKSR